MTLSYQEELSTLVEESMGLQAQPWTHGAVIYQIYPYSFQDGNGDGIGDLAGILQRLSYLQDLGIDAIWLTPIYPSPMKDFGYDVSDYTDINPIFGTLDEFATLVERFHAAGIKVIMDLVFNHTSDQHPWFLEAQSSRDHEKRDWYVWQDPAADGGPPNNWVSRFGGSAWEYHHPTGQYYLHTFLKEQPDLNWRNQEVQNEMMRIIHFWQELGVDAFRLDAVNYLMKDHLLRDDPVNPNFDEATDDPYFRYIHTHSANQVEVPYIIESFVAATREKEVFFISEAYVDLPYMHNLYESVNNQAHAPFNFFLFDLEWKATVFKAFIDTFMGSLRTGDVPIYVLGNHDSSRLATRLGVEHPARAALLLLTLPGMAFIYYGEEIGMEDTEVPLQETPEITSNKLSAFRREPARTPMQWNAQPHAGFTQVEPWLPVHKEYFHRNVETLTLEERSILQLYKKLIHMRKNSKILKWGGYVPVETNHVGVFGYIREYEGERFLILINFIAEPAEVRLDLGTGLILLETELSLQSSEVDLSRFTLEANTGYLLQLVSYDSVDG